MSWPHLVVAFGAGAGGFSGDEDTGAWSPAAPGDEEWRGWADVQDVGASVVRRQDTSDVQGDATAFLEDPEAFRHLRPGMRVMVVWDPPGDTAALSFSSAEGYAGYDVQDATIQRVTRLDNSIQLGWL